MWQRIFAVFVARNREFLRDRGTLAWNLVVPLVLVFGLAFAFDGERDTYKVGVLQPAAEIDSKAHPFFAVRYIDFVVYAQRDPALAKLGRHQLDLVFEPGETPRYWVNPESAKGYFVELALLQSVSPGQAGIEKAEIDGQAVGYADWVLPGILGMNMMFSCLFGVGYVVVRYRKNGFLKRLQATPLTSLEFIVAQVASRLLLTLLITAAIFLGTHLLLDTRMEGSYLTLLLVAAVGAFSLVSFGLIISARVTSEELAGGLLNMLSWPMMLLSGVWFSLEGAGDWLRTLAAFFPLTHILDAARAVILDGATLVDVAPALLALSAMSGVFLVIGARIFRWGP